MAAAGDAAGPAPQSVAEATHDLYRQYGKQIYAYCLHQLRSREEAEDAVQTTFLNAFRGLQRGTTTRFEQAWLYKIAQNVCIARRSSSGRRLKLESPDDFEILQEVVPSAASADGDTLELMGLEAALDAMPENQRRAILMREWQGMSYREIATELGLTQGAVEMLIFRARRTLAHALEQPVAEKKHASRARTGFSLGSLVAALKSMFSTGVALKMAAVAVSAAVVSTNGVVHSVIAHVAAPAKKRAAATRLVHTATVVRLVAATPTAGTSKHRSAVTARPAYVAQYTAPVTRKPIIAEDDPVADFKPAVTPVSAAPTLTPPPPPPPPVTPAPVPDTAPVTSSPPTPAATASTQSAGPQSTTPPAQSQTWVATGARKDVHGGRGNGVQNTWNAPQQPTQTTTVTTTTTTTTTWTTTTATPASSPMPSQSPRPLPVPPDTDATTTTTATTTTPPVTPPTPAVQPVPQPAPSSGPPSHGDGQGDGGNRNGWGNDGGGGRGHDHH